VYSLLKPEDVVHFNSMVRKMQGSKMQQVKLLPTELQQHRPALKAALQQVQELVQLEQQQQQQQQHAPQVRQLGGDGKQQQQQQLGHVHAGTQQKRQAVQSAAAPVEAVGGAHDAAAANDVVHRTQHKKNKHRKEVLS
jgi:hypothetical protein